MRTKSGLIIAPNQMDRRLFRRDIFEFFERITIEFLQSSQKMTFSLSDLTSFGAGIRLSDISHSEIFQVGQSLSAVRILVNGHEVGCYSNATIVHVGPWKDGGCIVGVRFELLSTIGKEAPVVRKKARISLNEKYLIKATVPHPFKYDDQILLDVMDISADGARFKASFRNRSILKGMVLQQIRFLLPDAESATADAIVTNVSLLEKGSGISVSVSFTSVSSTFRSSVARYLLLFGVAADSMMAQVKLAGFSAKQIKQNIEFGSLQTLDEYRQVLQLRLRAYSRAGKISNTIEDPNVMADEFDRNSVILVARARGQIVGSVRMTFCRKEGDRFELDESIQIPVHIDRDSAVEVSRLCVSDDFENSDLVLGLIERCTEVAIKASIEHVITSCVDSMLDYYRKIAFYPAGITFNLKTMHGIPHHLLVHESKSHQTASRMNPLYWKFAYSGVVDFFKRFGMNEDKKTSIFKRLAIKLMVPFVLAYKRKRQPKMYQSVNQNSVKPKDPRSSEKVA